MILDTNRVWSGLAHSCPSTTVRRPVPRSSSLQPISAGHEEVPLSTTSQEAGGRATGQALPPTVPARISAVMSRRFLEPVAVAFTSATLLFLRLMVPTPVGVADNYDGSRLLCHLSLHSTSSSDYMRMWTTWRYVFKAGNTCATTPYFNV